MGLLEAHSILRLAFVRCYSVFFPRAVTVPRSRLYPLKCGFEEKLFKYYIYCRVKHVFFFISPPKLLTKIYRPHIGRGCGKSDIPSITISNHTNIHQATKPHKIPYLIACIYKTLHTQTMQKHKICLTHMNTI